MIDEQFSEWILNIFEAQREPFTLLAIYKYVYQLENDIMAQVEELQAQIETLRSAIEQEKGEVGAKVDALSAKVAELEAAAGQGIDLSAAIAGVVAATNDVKNIVSEPVVAEEPLPSDMTDTLSAPPI